MENIDEQDKKVKLRNMIDRMESITKSTVEEFDMTFQEGTKREYNPKIRVMFFVPNDIQSMTDRQVMSEVLHNI